MKISKISISLISERLNNHLNCTDNGNVRWSVGGKIVGGRNKEQSRIYQNQDNSLVIQGVQEKDAGVISCILFTGDNELIANSALNIGGGSYI